VASVEVKLSADLISALEEDSQLARLLACRSLHTLLTLTACCLSADALNRIYPELLKRIDDSSDEVRAEALKALGAWFSSLGKDYDTATQRPHLQFLYQQLLLYLDDPDHRVQLLVLGLSTVALHSPVRNGQFEGLFTFVDPAGNVLKVGSEVDSALLEQESVIELAELQKKAVIGSDLPSRPHCRHGSLYIQPVSQHQSFISGHRTLPTGCCPQDAAHRTLPTGRFPQDAAHRTLPTGRCPQNTAHRTLPTEHCPQDAAHRTLPTGRCPQNAAHRTLPTGRCPQNTTHRTLPTEHYPQDAAHRTLPTGRCQQNTAYRTLPTGHCPQNTAHRTLPTEHYPQDAAHRTLPTEHCPRDVAHKMLLAG
ncbi:hypothetical protein NFI96_034161, partial [Prochilodus magdalenae]